MIILLALVAIVLFFTITKTQLFKKKNSNNKFMTQLGMAILVGILTVTTLITDNGESAYKYTAVGMGIMSFIAILIDMVISKKKHTI